MKLVTKQEMDLIEFETAMYLPARAVWYRYTPLQREFIYYSLCEMFKGYSYSDIMEYITCELLGDCEILPQFDYGYVTFKEGRRLVNEQLRERNMKKRIEEGSKELLREIYKKLIEVFPLNNNPEVAFDITHALYLGLGRQNVVMFDVVIEDLNKYASFTRGEINAHEFSALINSIESLKDVVLDYEPKTRRRNG